MGRVLIAGILAGLAMFLWESLAHMVLPISAWGMSVAPDQEGLRQALAAQLGDAQGLYFFPFDPTGAEPTPGPWGLLAYNPQWNFSWSVIGWELVNALLQGLLLALVVAAAAPVGFARRVGLAVLVGILAAIAVSPSYTYWYGFPAAYTAGQMIIVLGDYLLAGAVIALLVRSPAAPAAA